MGEFVQRLLWAPRETRDWNRENSERILGKDAKATQEQNANFSLFCALNSKT